VVSESDLAYFGDAGLQRRNSVDFVADDDQRGRSGRRKGRRGGERRQ